MSNRRGPARAKNNDQGEEVQLWKTIQEDIRTAVAEINQSNDNVRLIAATENHIAASADSTDANVTKQVNDLLKKLDGQYRSGVKVNDSITKKVENIIANLTILKGIQEANEKAGAPGPSSRSASFHAGPGRSSSRAGKPDKEREREREREREKEREKQDREREREREREKEKEREREREREKERDRERDRDRDADKDADKDKADLYDFDGAADSPQRSPAGSQARKLGGRSGGGPASDRSGTRDSVPPRSGDAPSKADSVEPQAASTTAASTSAAASTSTAVGPPSVRAKVLFSENQDVAFKPKPATPNDTSDWYLGKVKRVLGEGKGRRYIVKDEDPDVPSNARKEFRMSASGMIPIPPPATELPPLGKGKAVLALYPDSTTFYKAEVTGMDEAGNVNLRFEGEEQLGTQQNVERRFVVDYRD